ncbi:MAG: class I mannose-6-phosphate isomerase [Clostridia bacterium]|nr:class I mannose-6-phosphate isomerase [Clostridia bacterium]
MANNIASYPLLLGYTAKDYLWGGDKLKKYWNKVSDSQKIAESWEMSANDGGVSVVRNGALRGRPFKEVLHEYPFLSGAAYEEVFPLLIKLINAEEPLSIQVHPDDGYALMHEGKKGKCEMWYICDADEGAGIYLGLNRDISKAQLQDIIQNGAIESYLNRVAVCKGDYYLVPSGTLHAIGAGVTILEVQQNSDLTYRVYDYNRTDKDGNKRQLHIDKAVAVTDCKKYDLPVQNKAYEYGAGFKKRTLAVSEYFVTEEISIDGAMPLDDKAVFCGFTVIDGGGDINGEKITKGDTVFVPADYQALISGKMTIILYHI